MIQILFSYSYSFSFYATRGGFQYKLHIITHTIWLVVDCFELHIFYTWPNTNVSTAMGCRSPFSNFSSLDRNIQINRMYHCYRIQNGISLDRIHASWCIPPTEELRICAKWFAHRSRLHVAIQKGHPISKLSYWLEKMMKIVQFMSEKLTG